MRAALIALVLALVGSCGGGELDARKHIPGPVDRAHALSASSPTP